MIGRLAAVLWRLAGLLAASGPAQAYELRHIVVERSDTRYRLEMKVVLEVPAAAAFAVFSDAAQLPLINPAVRHAQVLSHASDSSQRWLTDLRLCAGPFCRQMRQVQHMRFDAQDAALHIRARVLPELSDLRFGTALWTFEPCAPQRSHLRFEAEVEPDFWVPPLIGPWLVRRSLREQAMRTSAGIEARARQLAGPEAR